MTPIQPPDAIAKFMPPADSAIDPSIQQTPVNMGFDPSLAGSDYGIPPVLDQFPDYDWAASFNFSNDWPNQDLGQIPQQTPGYGMMNFG
jgi:hypothetical protein